MGVYLLFALIGVLLIVMSSNQPFPDISKTYGIFLLLIFLFFLLANQAERMPNPIVSFAFIKPETISVAPIIDLKKDSIIGLKMAFIIIFYCSLLI